jgi:anthraniloyl-CoA monooxygenase
MRTSSSPPTASISAVRARHAGRFPAGSRRRKGEVHLARHDVSRSGVHVLFRRERARRVSAHCYRFDEQLSTFIVECDEASWRRAGYDTLDLDGTVAACESLFAPWLKGHRLMTNARHNITGENRLAAPWSNFTRVRNAAWFHENIVLIGDAAHTAHFSIGSGTKLAMGRRLSRWRASWRPAGRWTRR